MANGRPWWWDDPVQAAGPGFGFQAFADMAFGVLQDGHATNTKVWSGYDGSQLVINWTEPEGVFDRYYIMRKEREFPKSITDPDAIKVYDSAVKTTTKFADVEGNLNRVAGSAAPSDYTWYYYRVFADNSKDTLPPFMGSSGESEGFDLAYPPDGFDHFMFNTLLPDIWGAFDTATTQKVLGKFTDAVTDERVTLTDSVTSEGFMERLVRAIALAIRRLFVHADEVHQHYDFQRVRADALRHLEWYLQASFRDWETYNNWRSRLQDIAFRHPQRGVNTFLKTIAQQEMRAPDWYATAGWFARRALLINKDKVGEALTNHPVLVHVGPVWYRPPTAAVGVHVEHLYRKRVTLDLVALDVDEYIHELPYLIDYTDPELRSIASGGRVRFDDGRDIAFADELGVTAHHDIIHYDKDTGRLRAFVKLDRIRPQALPLFGVHPDPENISYTDVYLYFGGDNANQVLSFENPTSTWFRTTKSLFGDHSNLLLPTVVNMFRCVLHLDEEAGNPANASDTAITTTGANLEYVADTQVYRGVGFNGNDSQLKVNAPLGAAGSPHIVTDYTVSFWMYPRDLPEDVGTRHVILCAAEGGAAQLTDGKHDMEIFLAPTGVVGESKLVARVVDGDVGGVFTTSSHIVEKNRWYFVALSSIHGNDPNFGDFGFTKLLVNGDLDRQNIPASGLGFVENQARDIIIAPSIEVGGGNEGLGDGSDTLGRFNGIIDEFWVQGDPSSSAPVHHGVVREEWLSTAYMNQVNPAARASVHSVGPLEGAVSPNKNGLRDLLQADAGDVLFTLDNGTTKLNHEIAHYDSDRGHLQAWVQVPKVYKDDNTLIWMYLNNAGVANQGNTNATWSADFGAVNHAGSDSTANARFAGLFGGALATGVGRLDNSLSLDGVNDYASFTGYDVADSYTFMMWINPTSVGGGVDRAIFSKKTADNAIISALIADNADNPEYRVTFRGVTKSFGAEGVVPEGWTHLAVVFSDAGNGTTDILVYKNGVLLASQNYAALLGDVGVVNDWIIGANATANGDFFKGRIDEVRFVGAARSAAYINTVYVNEDAQPSNAQRTSNDFFVRPSKNAMVAGRQNRDGLETELTPVEMHNRVHYAWNPEQPLVIDGGMVKDWRGDDWRRIQGIDIEGRNDPHTWCWNPDYKSVFNERGWRLYQEEFFLTSPEKIVLHDELGRVMPKVVSWEIWDRNGNNGVNY